MFGKITEPVIFFLWVSQKCRLMEEWCLILSVTPNQKNIYGAALAFIAIMYGIIKVIIAVASLLATIPIPGNGRNPQ